MACFLYFFRYAISNNDDDDNDYIICDLFKADIYALGITILELLGY
jgi:hypothetical protein